MDDKCRLILRVHSRVERSGTATSADRDGAADATVSAECAACHLHGAAAGGELVPALKVGIRRVRDRIAADRRGASVSARAEERDNAAFYLDTVEIGNRACVGEGMLPAGIDRAGIRATSAGDVAQDGAAGDVERVVIGANRLRCQQCSGAAAVPGRGQ